MAFESGSIAWSALQSTFGGANPIYLSEYYRGGGLVPNVSQNNGVPTAGTISAANFRGSTAATLTLSPNPANRNDFVPEPAPSTRSMSIGCSASGAGLSSGTWTRLSGSTSPASASTLSVTFSATVGKNSEVTAQYRFDGNNGLSATVNVSLMYSTDL